MSDTLDLKACSRHVSNKFASALRTNNSICNLILSSSSIFLRFWLVDTVRDTLLDSLDQHDLAKLRLVCHDFSQKIAPRLFVHLDIQFRNSTFSRPSRIAALERIGHHTHSLELKLPRTADTFLPPLINANGEEEAFVYKPNVSPTASASVKYGSDDAAVLLVKQYPPLFHSSTNVPAFVRALTALPNLARLTVNSPSSEVTQCQGWRSTVDYALISLRIAIERAPLYNLDTLSFSPIHPSGLLYMQPHGVGGNPGSVRRWSQIRHMSIDMESSPIERSVRSDQLKTLHHYLRTFAGSLSSFHFRWHGPKGPSPMSLDTEPGIFPGNQETGAGAKDGTAIKFKALHHVNVQNAEIDASQISAFICSHRRTLEEFNFESIKLRSGDWEQALSPLAKMRQSRMYRPKAEEPMEVPIILSVPFQATRTVVASPGVRREPEATKHPMIQRWITKAKVIKAKEHLKEGSEHMRSLLRHSIPWR